LRVENYQKFDFIAESLHVALVTVVKFLVEVATYGQQKYLSQDDSSRGALKPHKRLSYWLERGIENFPDPVK
jgi:hypothetical protein